MLDKFLFGSTDLSKIRRDAYFWNMVSSVLNSFQAVVLLLIITRTCSGNSASGNLTDSAVFVIAYALANLLMCVGKYGIRNYQVTDVSMEHSFRTYAVSRVYSSILMIVFMVFVLGYRVIFCDGYSTYKVLCIVGVCLWKLIETVEDCLHGLSQQQNRLDIAAKILSIRFIVYYLVFGVMYVITKNLCVTLYVCVGTGVLVALVMDGRLVRFFKDVISRKGEDDNKTSAKRGMSLMKSCFLLASCNFAQIYISNAPKYTIDSVVTNEVQTCFNIVFMPVFVIQLMSSIIYNPILSTIATMWNEGDFGKLKKRIIKQVCYTLAITAFCLLCAYFLGIPVLQLVYNVNLDGYLPELLLFLTAGGFLALQTFMFIVLTAFRKQNQAAIAYLVISLLNLFLGGVVLKNYGLMNLCAFYCVMIVVLASIFCFMVFFYIAKRKGETLKNGN